MGLGALYRGRMDHREHTGLLWHTHTHMHASYMHKPALYDCQRKFKNNTSFISCTSAHIIKQLISSQCVSSMKLINSRIVYEWVTARLQSLLFMHTSPFCTLFPLKCQFQAESVTHQAMEDLPKSPGVIAAQKYSKSVGETDADKKKMRQNR